MKIILHFDDGQIREYETAKKVERGHVVTATFCTPEDGEMMIVEVRPALVAKTDAR